ncbi:hypothetical protein [Pseudobutyrivibrio xylanivorans]|uniref:Uncharacterized protein n=1 Tax=Pseudobutyrivibrio xylanivorans TaxID=185007 RepID=A0A5P6VNG0_PSEXY|nr:hypothetical protein [Pseudobutyrivibrio xylanivorans]QFJ53898.1 hypothetical protein FXF36_02955 [Pseudobutyrivibrio xylanivorans]
MKILKYIKRGILPLTVAFSLALPTTSHIVYAESTNTFVPFRNYIPAYLAKNSDTTSELVTKLWAKLFYEESTWSPNSNQGKISWVDKYDDTFFGLGGTEKRVSDVVKNNNGNIALSTGDFEAFFANTLLANPKFFGQLLGLNRYKAISDNTSGTAYLREIMCSYLAQPDKYKYVSEAILKLTADHPEYLVGKPLAQVSATVNGVNKTADYWLLTTLASFYKVKTADGSGYVLSTKQTSWVESYQLALYKEYINAGGYQGNNSLAGKYPSIYELIARSKYAANNYGGDGVKGNGGNAAQNFFNYIVSTGKGGGAWLNLNDNISITGLDTIDNIEELIGMAEGYCGGLENYLLCDSSVNCRKNAVPIELYMYKLYKNNTAVNFINGNSTLNPLLNGTGGYIERFKAKHLGRNANGTLSQYIYAGPNAIEKKENSWSCACWDNLGYHDGGRPKTCSASVSATLSVGSAAFLPTAKYIIISATDGTSLAVTSGNQGNGKWTNRPDLSNWSLISNGVNIKSAIPEPTYIGEGTGSSPRRLRFDISSLSATQRANATLYVQFESYDSYSPNCPNGSGSHGTVTAKVGVSGTVEVITTYADCDVKGHTWNCDATLNSDMKTATITYTCGKNATHTHTITNAPVKVTTTDSEIVYSVFAAKLNDYKVVKRVARTTGSSDQTILLNSSNTSGSLLVSASSSKVNEPAGSKSSRIYTEANVNMYCSVHAGVIKAGAKSVTLNFNKINTKDVFKNLSITLYSSTGKIMGTNKQTVVGTQDMDIHNSQYTNDYTVRLVPAQWTDSDYENCYLVISASACAQNWTSPGNTPSPATAKIQLDSLTINY